MSSGVEADIALDAAVVLSLGMNRVLGAGAGLAAGGAGALAALAEGRAEAREAALREAADHERAVRAVLDVNARIAALEASQRRAAEGHGLPAEVALPEPLPPGERPTAGLASWCAATEKTLDDAEQELSANIGAAVAGQIFSVPATALHTAVRTASPEARAAENVPPAARRDELARTLARVLGRVLPDTADADHTHIAEAAGRLVSAGTVQEAEGQLTEVRLRVQNANRRTEAARAEARRLEEERRAAEQAEDERRYVLDTIATAFGDLGYDVDTGFETMTAHDGTIVLTRGNWPEHAVRMRIDPGDATLRAAMVRDGAPRSEEERRVDAEREREWCDAFEAARDHLAAAGVHSDVRWRIEPGVQQLPSAPEAQRAGARSRPRERERERPR